MVNQSNYFEIVRKVIPLLGRKRCVYLRGRIKPMNTFKIAHLPQRKWGDHMQKLLQFEAVKADGKLALQKNNVVLQNCVSLLLIEF